MKKNVFSKLKDGGKYVLKNCSRFFMCSKVITNLKVYTYTVYIIDLVQMFAKP